MIHWSCRLVAPSSSTSDGNATLRIVLSIVMISRVRLRVASVYQRRA